MNEKIISELIDSILHITDATAIQGRVVEYCQALEWAEQEHRWDLVINLSDALCSRFIYSRVIKLTNETQDIDQVTTALKNFWEQGREWAKQGLRAARETGQEEVPFLAYLSELSAYLEEFQIALDYLKQELHLIHPDVKWRTLREVHFLGVQAMEKGEFLTARDCFQTRLDEWEKLGNIHSMAETLAWMAINEDRQNNQGTAKQLIERSNELRKQLKKDSY